MIRQEQKNKTIIIRVDGHRKFGLGHLYRCLNLAIAFRDRFQMNPVFLTKSSSLDSKFEQVLNYHEFKYHSVSTSNPYKEEFSRTKRYINEYNPVLIITDLLTPEPCDIDLLTDIDLVFDDVSEYIIKLKEFKVPIMSVTDELDDIKIRPDVVMDHSCHFPIDNYNEIEGTIFYIGPKYYLLGQDFQPYLTTNKVTEKKTNNILIMFGGSDQNEFTYRITKTLNEKIDVLIKVILGPAVINKAELKKKLELMKVTVLDSIDSVADEMFNADLAITSGGNTVFEFAAVGTPIVTLCTRQRQNQNAEYFESQGSLINLGIGTKVSNEEVYESVVSLISNYEKRKSMSEVGKKLVDGLGLERICRVVNKLVTNVDIASI